MLAIADATVRAVNYDAYPSIVVPPEHESGSYADFMNVWHTRHGFTLDFAAPLGEEGAFGVTARVRVPATAIFEFVQKLNADIAVYELDYGEIRRPRRLGEDE